MVILDELIKKYPELDVCREDILQAFELLKSTYAGGGKLLVCGNGGSAADSEHIVGELMKGYLKKRPFSIQEAAVFQAVLPETGTYLSNHLQGALPAISLVSHVALNTAFANDVAADMIFAQQVYGYGRPGDCLWALSTSGNAQNVLFALQTARVKGLRTLGLTGKSGGKMIAWCDVTIRVPWDETPAIQERHLPVIHALCALLEEEFFP